MTERPKKIKAKAMGFERVRKNQFIFREKVNRMRIFMFE